MIKLSKWQVFVKKMRFPLDQNMALDMCDNLQVEMLTLKQMERLKVWNQFMDEMIKYDKIFASEFEKHRKHLTGIDDD